MHMEISQGNIYARIYSKNAVPQRAYPDLTPAFTLTVRALQCGHAVWGIAALDRSPCSSTLKNSGTTSTYEVDSKHYHFLSLVNGGSGAAIRI